LGDQARGAKREGAQTESVKKNVRKSISRERRTQSRGRERSKREIASKGGNGLTKKKTKERNEKGGGNQTSKQDWDGRQGVEEADRFEFSFPRAMKLIGGKRRATPEERWPSISESEKSQPRDSVRELNKGILSGGGKRTQPVL